MTTLTFHDTGDLDLIRKVLRQLVDTNLVSLTARWETVGPGRERAVVVAELEPVGGRQNMALTFDVDPRQAGNNQLVKAIGWTVEDAILTGSKLIVRFGRNASDPLPDPKPACAICGVWLPSNAPVGAWCLACESHRTKTPADAPAILSAH